MKKYTVLKDGLTIEGIEGIPAVDTVIELDSESEATKALLESGDIVEGESASA